MPWPCREELWRGAAVQEDAAALRLRGAGSAACGSPAGPHGTDTCGEWSGGDS